MTPDQTPDTAATAVRSAETALAASAQTIDDLAAALDETSIELGETKRRLALRDGQLQIAGDDVRRFAAEARAYRDAYHLARIGVDDLRAHAKRPVNPNFAAMFDDETDALADRILSDAGRALDRATERDKILTVTQAMDALSMVAAAPSPADQYTAPGTFDARLRRALDEAAW